jgi:hypothetical protein
MRPPMAAPARNTVAIAPVACTTRRPSAGTGLVAQMRLIRLLLRANTLSLPAKEGAAATSARPFSGPQNPCHAFGADLVAPFA